MPIRFRSLGRVLLATGMILGLLAPAALAQDAASESEKELRRVAGNWTLNPLAPEAPEPTPPPIYASYRKKDEPPPPALESIPRILFKIEQGKLTGMGVLPSAVPMTDENRDVSGKEAVAVEEISFQGDQLNFKIQSGEGVFEASLTLEGRALKGTWTMGSQSGPLYLFRRYR